MQYRLVITVAFTLLAIATALWLARSDFGDGHRAPELPLVREDSEDAARANVTALEPSAVPAATREPAPAVAEEPGSAPVVPTLQMLEDWFGPLTPTVEIAGDITGRLLSESGAWPDDRLPARDEIVIDLVSEADHSANWRGVLSIAKDEHGENQITFAFRDVPVGRYELTLSSLASFRWTPRSMFVSPPAAGLEFMRYDAHRGTPLAFRVFDRETGDELQEYDTWLLNQTESNENGVLMHAGPLSADSLAEGARFRWSLHARGYAPFFGDEASFALDGVFGTRVADVYLERGFGTLLVVLGPDPNVRPMAGVAVVLDGEAIGETLSDGSFWVQSPTMPERLEVRHEDWVATKNPLGPMLIAGLARRGYVTAIMIRPPE
ncbi:MAG: hypothetical protein E2O39_16760 [Planctomycetota bacterium]|nr:MAG: hypothetical protein E2O39_16760 [Planctomycetota bacterium]